MMHTVDENRNTWSRLKRECEEQRKSVNKLKSDLEKAEKELEKTEMLIAPFNKIYEQ